MKRLTTISAAIVLAGGIQLAYAQPPGGGGGFTPPTFDAINQADADGNKDDHLTLEEVTAYFEEMMAGFGGGRGGGGPGGGMDIAAIFAGWDTVPEGGDGMITEEEWDARPARGGGPGRAGGGGGRFGGGPPQ